MHRTAVRKQELNVTAAERAELMSIVRRRSGSVDLARRVRVILLSDDGLACREIAQRVGLSQEQVSRIRTRFIAERVAGLAERKKAGRKDHAVSEETAHRIAEMALSPPPAGRSRWTTRMLGNVFDLTSATIAKVLRAKSIKPHLKRTFKVSRDPFFADKTRAVVGMYLNPPDNAVVLSVDEKTQIQALQRTQPPLPLRQGRAVRHTHDYKRNGVLDLYAALNVVTGEVSHACTNSHTGADFLAFMKKVAKQHPNVALHVILDNSSTHSTPAVKQWLAENPRVTFHFTPTSASWLNEVEGFFGILSKQSLWISDFPSKKALRSHIERFIRDWNRRPTPFIWTKEADALIEAHRKASDAISHAAH